MMQAREPFPRYLLCLRNDGYLASLEDRQVYQVIRDTIAAARQLVRVIDESGEDYRYPESYFIPIDLPHEAVQAFAHAS